MDGRGAAGAPVTAQPAAPTPAAPPVTGAWQEGDHPGRRRFTDVGHVCALAIGVGCGLVLHWRGHVAASRPALIVSLAGVGTYAYLKPTIGPIAGAAALTAGALIVREVRAATMRSRAPGKSAYDTSQGLASPTVCHTIGPVCDHLNRCPANH